MSKYEPTQNELALVCAYESLNGIPQNEYQTRWIGDYALYDTSSAYSVEKFQETLSSALQQANLTRDELNELTFVSYEALEKLLLNEPEKKSYVGRIDYLHTDGSVRESIEYDNESSFIQCIQEETYYGVPFSIVLYKDKDGKTIPTDFLLELDPPPCGLEYEPAPTEKTFQQHSTIRFAKRQIYNTREYKKDDGKTVTLVNVALPKGSKYAGYYITLNRKQIHDDKFSSKMAFASISQEKVTLYHYDKDTRERSQVSISAEQLKQEFKSWKKKETPDRTV